MYFYKSRDEEDPGGMNSLVVRIQMDGEGLTTRFKLSIQFNHLRFKTMSLLLNYSSIFFQHNIHLHHTLA
jgi:hypothetical protein